MLKHEHSRLAPRLCRLPGTLFCLGLASGAGQAADTPPAADGVEQTIENALNPSGGRYGKLNVDLRWRYEYVDQDTAKTPGPAEASTARLRVGYLTPDFVGFKAFAEYEGNQDIGVNDYNSGTNGKTRFPVIADPQTNEVNQLWLSYSGLPQTALKVGRQRVVFDNHRFIGDVIWRQMQQTYDAATVTTLLIPQTTVTAGYFFGVQDILSHYARMNSPVLNVNVDTGFGKLIGYGYWLDFEDKGPEGGFVDPKSQKLTRFAKSNKTFGLRFDGGMPLTDGIKALYTLEYAHQQDYGNQPKSYEADYWLAEGGVDLYGLTLKAAYEELGADNGIGFQTPLATLHAFQGWADQFLATPPDGIRDLYGTVKYTLYGVDLMAVYHEFSDHNGGQDFGREVDLLAEKKFGKHYSVLFKFADFVVDRGPDGGTALGKADAQKFWIQASVSF